MKTVIVGGGRGCLAILELLEAGQVRELDIEAACVVDTDVTAPGFVFAAERGIRTLTDCHAALSLPGVELILELTGNSKVLADLYHNINPGVRVIDHVSARVFWDLIRLEDSLREELNARAVLETRFNQFINSANEVISIKDTEGRYVVVNPATAALFEMEPHQLIGRTPAELYDPEVAETITAHDNEVIENRRYANYTERLVIDRKETYLDVTRFPLLDYQGNVDGVCSIARDITQERQLRRQLIQSAKLAAVGRLAADVAHEINNPLTGVLAYAENLLEEAESNDPRRADYEVIIRESLRCREIVRTLLDFARQEEPSFQVVDLNDVVNKALALVERQAEFQDTAVERKMAKSHLRVNADARQLQQIILNLILNANEAMEGQGTITILSGLLPDEARCFVTVRDDGPGVPSNVRDRIFEPFFSTKSTAGLGLAVSWGIIQRHGGTLTVHENPAGGADLRVELPCANGSDGPD